MPLYSNSIWDIRLPLIRKEFSELSIAYHQTGFPYLYPRFDTMEVRGKKAYLSFTDCTGPLQIKGKQIQDLQVAGEDGVFVNAEAKVEKDKLVVWSKQVKKIKAVR